MYGAIIGDINGSIYEFNNHKSKDFEMFSREMDFTDDTVMTIAVADSLLHGIPIRRALFKWYQKYPFESYGLRFMNWLEGGACKPLRSFGNGSAMRVSPVGLLARSVEQVKQMSYEVTAVSHGHPEGLKGAEATAMMIFLAKKGKSKEELRAYFKANYYPQHIDLDEVRNNDFYWNESCQGTVPQAMECFFQSNDFEDCIRTAISIGGDSDTIGAICGGVAEAFYGVPAYMVRKTNAYLSEEIRVILDELYEVTNDRN